MITLFKFVQPTHILHIIFSTAVLTVLLFKWGKTFQWNLTISQKIRETWENGAFWLAEMGGHMTFEWDLTKMETKPSFTHMEMTWNYYQWIEEIKSFSKLQAEWKLNHYYWEVTGFQRLAIFWLLIPTEVTWKWWKLVKNWYLLTGSSLLRLSL